MRKDVVGLTDAFGLPDFVLKAPIARYDGDIYQSKLEQFSISYQHLTKTLDFADYFETLLQAPGSVGVPPYHAKYIKPLTERYEKK
jgi:acyl-CoA oxidase